MSGPECSLCGSSETRHLVDVDSKTYWRCGVCALTFLDASSWLTSDEERAVYELHDNDVGDAGYRRFLSKLAGPLLERIQPGALGLDYGCGPGPALAAMLGEGGCDVRLYDPFFANDPAVLACTYDFVVCTETAEHFQRPGEQFERLDALLRPGGWLGVMTCFQTDDARFAGWHYRRDPTHVVFYREHTLRYVASMYGWRCEVVAKDVVLFQK